LCLAIPAKVVELNYPEATVAIGGVARRARMDLLPDVSVGDYVIVHAGFAIQKLDEKEALKTLRLLSEIAGHQGPEDP